VLPFLCTHEVPNSTPTRQVQVETRFNSVVDFKVVWEVRNKGRVKFKLKQEKPQTKDVQVTVNGDILRQLASVRDTPNAGIGTIPEEQTPHMLAMEHPNSRVLARLERTTSYPQWRLNGLRVCDTRVACICTNVDCVQVSCSRYFRKFNGFARSYRRLDRVHTQLLPLRLKLVEFNPPLRITHVC